jgi:hypothetical protein
MAIHPNELHFYREQQKIIADSRARAQQRANDWAASRQRQRDQQAWAEHAASLKRRMELPPRPRQKPPVLVPSRAVPFYPPEESVKRPTLRPSSHARYLVERTLAFVLTLVMWAFAALVAVPWLYASAFNRALVAVAVSFGLAVNLAVLIVCGVELLLLCRAGRSIAERTAMCITAGLVLPFVVLDAIFGPLLRLVFRRKSS